MCNLNFLDKHLSKAHALSCLLQQTPLPAVGSSNSLYSYHWVDLPLRVGGQGAHRTSSFSLETKLTFLWDAAVLVQTCSQGLQELLVKMLLHPYWKGSWGCICTTSDSVKLALPETTSPSSWYKRLWEANLFPLEGSRLHQNDWHFPNNLMSEENTLEPLLRASLSTLFQVRHA